MKIKTLPANDNPAYVKRTKKNYDASIKIKIYC